ncbi:MAG: DUF2851 family protein [Opitutaceae bacterium]|jgi:hypothetical protein
MTQEPASSKVFAVAEVQGLYGPFSFPELLLQKIWDRRDFSERDARTLDGRTVVISHSGRWNRLSGPDFKNARMRLDGQEITGDVEVHLREADWTAHRHAHDPAYDNVVLHVVLFPPAVAWTVGSREKRIPVLVLLPLLHRGLEEYAAEDAVEALANRPLDHAHEALGALDGTELHQLLRRHASERWKQKVGFARERIRRLGWEDACHHAALEILGYRFNRAPMLAVATEYPLAAWRDGKLETAEVFEVRRERWALQGVRPLNHPRLRLRQYAAWVMARPDWPERLQDLGGVLRSAAESAVASSGEGSATRATRRVARLTALRGRLADELCADAVAGSRFDNLVCDGFLPLLAADAVGDTGLVLEALWRDWFAGDAPADRARLLRHLEVFGGAAKPSAHGPLQGLLGWMLVRERSQGG